MSDDCPHPSEVEHVNGDHVVVVCGACGAWLRSFHK